MRLPCETAITSTAVCNLQDKIKTAKVVMGRAMQLQEQQMMQEREREYDQALDQCMDQDRLQVAAALLLLHMLVFSCLAIA